VGVGGRGSKNIQIENCRQYKNWPTTHLRSFTLHSIAMKDRYCRQEPTQKLVVVIMIWCRGKGLWAKAVKEGCTTPVVGLSFLVSRHAASCGVDGQLVVTIAAPINNDAIPVHRPVRVSRILFANEVVSAVGMELDLHRTHQFWRRWYNFLGGRPTSNDPSSYSSFQTLPPQRRFFSTSENLRTN
jgi:hypothetical protein